MHIRNNNIHILFYLAFCVLLASCGNADCSLRELSPDDCINPDTDGEWHSVEYVEEASGPRDDFSYYGPSEENPYYLYYFPAFNLDPEKGPRTNMPTDGKATIEEYVRPGSFKKFTHLSDLEIIEGLILSDNVFKRTFSLDDRKDPAGVKTAGGFGAWSEITLPDRERGISGVAYDRETKKSSNNSINQIIVNDNETTAFCLHVLVDNTQNDFDPDIRINAQSDGADYDLRQMHYDGHPDVYTFRYTGMRNNDRVKIKLRSNKKRLGGGIGGLLISTVDQCCTAHCGPENECGGNDGCGSPCPCDPNEVQFKNLEPNSSLTGQAYYLRGIYTRQVLTYDAYSEGLYMEPRRESSEQHWTFIGSCGNAGDCRGYFVNLATQQCLRKSEDGRPSAVLGDCDGDKHLWVVSERGPDIVLNGEDFKYSEGVSKYAIRHQASENNYLVARCTRSEAENVWEAASMRDANEPMDTEMVEAKMPSHQRACGALRVEDRGKPNKPWDYWIFEAVQE